MTTKAAKSDHPSQTRSSPTYQLEPPPIPPIDKGEHLNPTLVPTGILIPSRVLITFFSSELTLWTSLPNKKVYQQVVWVPTNVKPQTALDGASVAGVFDVATGSSRDDNGHGDGNEENELGEHFFEKNVYEKSWAIRLVSEDSN